MNAALVPQKLVEGGMDPSQAISELGVVCGMTLPMLALPTVFLGAMSLVLVPRLARSAAPEPPPGGAADTDLPAPCPPCRCWPFPAMGMMAVLGEELGVLLFQPGGGGGVPPPPGSGHRPELLPGRPGGLPQRGGPPGDGGLDLPGVRRGAAGLHRLPGGRSPPVGMGGFVAGDAGLHRPGAAPVRLAADAPSPA